MNRIRKGDQVIVIAGADKGKKGEVVRVDGDKVVLSFGDSKYVNQARVLHVPIVPKHIWENFDDPATDPVKGDDLVGTGPTRQAAGSNAGKRTTEQATARKIEGFRRDIRLLAIGRFGQFD